MTVVATLAIGNACSSRPPEVAANDNRTPAGTFRGDTLVVRMVVQPARWHPEAADGPFVDTEALGEEGKAPSIPAPLLRVPTGTIISATVRNALPDSTVWLQGLFARPVKERQDSVAVPPGESRTVTFAAGASGTYTYFARVGHLDYSAGEREQLSGAFVVDSANAVPNDRVFVMNIWSHNDSTRYRNVLAINGKSFPHSEGMTATTGDSIRWRWVNGSVRPHPMHLHGFYFNVDARGSFRTDTTYSEPQRRSVVTELMAPFSTMAMSWVPDRDGRWLFHCHISFHSVSSDARLDPPPGDHAMMSGDPGEHMAGLVLGIDVAAAPDWTAEPRPSPRKLRLFVLEGAKLGRSDRSMGYAIEHGSESPSSSLTRVGGPPLVLTRGQPTDITVINTLKEPTAVHWHGLELESYSDGVSGWSGRTGNLAPRIAPSDSFVARLSMPRAGTFIYHTHLNDLEQLTSGLYGAIIVKEPREAFDPSRDHVYVVGWDGPRFLVNGDSVLPPMTWRAGHAHRLRLVNIGPAEGVRMEVGQDTITSVWQLLAKDGADLPAHQAATGPATVTIDVGETADFMFTPPRKGEYILSIQLVPAKEPITQRIVVR